MTVSTATVETLTAEVRVLMVGRRQVTLSVFRQLDEVAFDKIEPFGRVNESRDGLQNWLVGRCRKSGTLARAQYGSGAYPFLPTVLRGHLDGGFIKIGPCLSGNRFYRLSFGDHEIQIETSAARRVHQIHQDCPNCAHWQTNGHDAAIADCIAEWQATDARHRAAKGLPLIVLAGLR